MKKEELKKLATNNFYYVGFWNGFFRYVKKDLFQGYIEVKARKKDLTNGNLNFMLLNGLTR